MSTTTASAPMHITIDRPDEVAMMNQADRKVALAESIVIDSDVMFQEAGSELQSIVSRIKELDEQRTAITGPILQSKKLIDELFKRPITRLEQARDVIKGSMLAYQREAARKAQEAREAAEAAARREREELAAKAAAAQAKADAEAAVLRQRAEAAAAAGQVAQAAKLESKADSRETAGAAIAAELTMASQAVAHVAPVASSAPRAAGISTRTKWKAEVVDKARLIAAVAANPAYLHFLSVNETALNQFAVATQGNADVAGVRFFQDQILAARRR